MLAQPAPDPAVQQSWLDATQSPALADVALDSAAPPRASSTMARDEMNARSDRGERIECACQQT
jgi:hypothetical protein